MLEAFWNGVLQLCSAFDRQVEYEMSRKEPVLVFVWSLSNRPFSWNWREKKHCCFSEGRELNENCRVNPQCSCLRLSPVDLIYTVSTIILSADLRWWSFLEKRASPLC
ncbi:hypothetical protein O6H91_08G113600 [Diphasiastrum complanatum]|uniref:Uncharacterized protein n=1 Tax=Diphasiastrum complanatum TaxID=34168 RepID=A0ACC2D172_DIPCM|nr:hypothetical protein O6H91_08G113600 [Diphasiastrum complanatum]